MANNLAREQLRTKSERYLKDLEDFVNKCDNRALRTAFFLGELKLEEKDTNKVARLISIYETSCQCNKLKT